MTKPVKTKETLHPQFGKSAVARSPRFQQIMERWQFFGHTMSGIEFFRREVKTIDPQITEIQWNNFYKKLNKTIERRANAIIGRVATSRAEVLEAQERSIGKLTAIAEASLDDIIQNPSILLTVPVDKRLKILTEAMKAMDRRIGLGLKKRDDDRKQTLYDEMMNEARYGSGTPEGAPVSSEDLVIEEPPERPDAEAYLPKLSQVDHEKLGESLPPAIKREESFDPEML